jgi:uncharacterized membrane protein|nr:MAG TPA: hypothetical protein [Caudoviricetes sp.]
MPVQLIDKIKQKNNGTFKLVDASDINWNVNIPSDKVPAEYVKKDAMNTAIANAVAGAPHLKRVVLAKGSTLPSTGEENTIYMLPDLTESSNEYTEYFWVNGKFEKIGGSKTDLTNYPSKSEMNTAINAAKSAASTDAQNKANKALTDAKAYTDKEKAKYLPLAGGTLSGKVKYAANQSISDNNDLATKAYVDATTAGARPNDMLTSSQITTGTVNGTIKVKDKNVQVFGLKSAAYHESTDFLTPDDLTWHSIV